MLDSCQYPYLLLKTSASTILAEKSCTPRLISELTCKREWLLLDPMVVSAHELPCTTANDMNGFSLSYFGIISIAGKTTLIKLMTGELQPTKGQIKKNMHLKISRFTQHFEEKLDLTMTPLDFFKQKLMPEEPIERIRPLLGRYGCTGDQQSQVMGQLSAGQKARIVFAIIAHEKPHLLLLDEPTNPLDMESIDALARCLNKFKGGVLMISHDMRLISQCAQEIYVCDHKKVTKYRGDIMDFKLHTKKENTKKLAQHMNG